MSDSPKYSTARLSSEREQGLLEGVLRAAKQWQQRQAAAREERRRLRLERARIIARQEIDAVERELRRFAAGTLVQFAPQKRLLELQRQARDLASTLGQAADEGAVRQANEQVSRLREEFSHLAAASETRRLETSLGTQQALVDQLKREIAALGAERSLKFDPIGQREVQLLVGRTEELLRQRKESESRKALATARGRLELHQTDVAAALARWSADKAGAEAALALSEDELAALRLDEMVMRWSAPEVTALEERMARCEKLLASEQFASVCNEAAQVRNDADRVVQQARQAQLKEDRRQYIVNGIIDVMKRMGFVIQGGFPALEHSQFPASATIIKAQRLSGGAMAVSVPQEGEIHYAVAGFPMRRESDGRGQIMKTCDEAEQEIQAMHTKLKELQGIEMSELIWEGKPDRLSRATRDEGAPAQPNQSQQERGAR